MTRTDTIVAAATPPGRGGVGIVRVSGPKTPEIAAADARASCRRRAAHLRARSSIDGSADRRWAWRSISPRPHSYTGEDVLELQGARRPGGASKALLARVLSSSAPRPRRARRVHAARLPQRQARSRAGRSHRRPDRRRLARGRARCDALAAGRVLARWCAASPKRWSSCARYVEAAIDFPEEEIDFLADRRARTAAHRRARALRCGRASARQGRLLREGMTVVIAGRPNAGQVEPAESPGG